MGIPLQPQSPTIIRSCLKLHLKISLSKLLPESKTNLHGEKNPCLWSDWILKPVSSEQLERRENVTRGEKKNILKTMTARKKLLLQREGLGQLPIHRVCAFAIARLNQYVSNSA